ncbi:MAG: peptidoglycan endopeptidase [Ignavibacteria bacterium]|nr:peptidoglycan endopeptidase [Ignavibacteria bacterium]
MIKKGRRTFNTSVFKKSISKLVLIASIVALLSSCAEEKKVIIQTENKEIKPNYSEKKIEITTKEKPYAVAIINTPVLYTKDFKGVFGGKSGYTLKKSKTGLVKEVEFVAYPGTFFEILGRYKMDNYFIFKVKCDDYDIVLGGDSLYIDSRFVELTDERRKQPPKEIPSMEEIYKYFDKSVGALYVWGANNLSGVPEMMKYYPPTKQLNSEDNKTWMLKGVDCSGLLYEATNGCTPRNTYQLVSYGESIPINGLNALSISKILKPLDLIVWKGHLIIVYDENTAIQSAHSAGGVVKKDLLSELERLCSKRTPCNNWSDDNPNSFVIRRWFDASENKHNNSLSKEEYEENISNLKESKK